MDLSGVKDRPVRSAVLAMAVVAAVAMLLIPVQATYLNRVGSDFAEYRTATCGPPITSLLGAEADLGGGSEHPIGGQASEVACEAASAKRVIGALLLLLGATVGWSLTRDRPRSRSASLGPSPAG